MRRDQAHIDQPTLFGCPVHHDPDSADIRTIDINGNRVDTIESRSWEHMAEAAYVPAMRLLETHFGERCPDECLDPPCPICARYRALDELLKNPYEDKP